MDANSKPVEQLVFNERQRQDAARKLLGDDAMTTEAKLAAVVKLLAGGHIIDYPKQEQEVS